MQYGGCSPTDGCYAADATRRIDFPVRHCVLASVVQSDAPATVCRRPGIKTVDGVQGRVHRHDARGHPQLVAQAGVADLTSPTRWAAGNRGEDLQKKKGVKAIVVMHPRGRLPDAASYSSCSGDLRPDRDIAQRLAPDRPGDQRSHPPAVRVLTSPTPRGSPPGHQRDVVRPDITETNFKLDNWTGDVIRKSEKSVNHIVTRTSRRTRGPRDRREVEGAWRRRSRTAPWPPSPATSGAASPVTPGRAWPT